jgi:hypothetical protein
MVTKDESYWIVRVFGTEQGWSRSNPKVLEKPRPFVGYISSTDWAYQASRERQWAHKFTTRPGAIDPTTVGPWWYKCTRLEIIKVRRIVEETEEIE